MVIDQLKIGQELLELIEITEEAIKRLKQLSPENREAQRVYDDKLFWLNISKHKDGSGIQAKLNRYYGNKRLLEVIINELEKQLNEFKTDFSNL